MVFRKKKIVFLLLMIVFNCSHTFSQGDVSTQFFFKEMIRAMAKVMSEMIGEMSKTTNNLIDKSFNSLDKNMKEMHKTTLRLSDDIGKMADRIGTMADRIVKTEEMIKDLAEKILKIMDKVGANKRSLQTESPLLMNPKEGDYVYSMSPIIFEIIGDYPLLRVYFSQDPLFPEASTTSAIIENGKMPFSIWSRGMGMADQSGKLFIAIRGINKEKRMSSISNAIQVIANK